MSRQFQPTVLIAGDYKESLVVVRSLGRAGCKVVVGKPGSQEITFAKYSRFTSEVWKHPDFDNEDQFIPAFLAFLRSRRDIQYVLPRIRRDYRIGKRIHYFTGVRSHANADLLVESWQGVRLKSRGRGAVASALSQLPGIRP